MSTSSEVKFEAQLKSTINRLKELPATELNYYIALLIASIQNEQNKIKHLLLLQQVNKLIFTLNQFYKNPEDADKIKENFQHILTEVDKLIQVSKTQSNLKTIRNIILKIGSVVCVILLGTLGALFGIALGPFSKNFIKGVPLGFVSGLAIGCLIGGRIPDKICKSDLERKLEFTLSSIQKNKLGTSK